MGYSELPEGASLYTVTDIINSPVEAVPQKVKSAYETAVSTKAPYETVEFSEELLAEKALEAEEISQHITFIQGDSGGGSPAADVDRWQQLLQGCSELGLLDNEEVKLERSDPKHRMGHLLAAALEIYNEKRPPSDSFLKWLDGMAEWDRVTMLSNAMKSYAVGVFGKKADRLALKRDPGVVDQMNLKPSMVKAFLTGVAYLDQATRPNYLVTFKAGLANYRGNLLDSTGMRTVFSGNGFGIWVMDSGGRMYAGNHVLGQLHHSSFLSGEKIRAGGELKAKNGTIEFLSGKSGHYQPPIANLVFAVKALEYHGVVISQMRVLVFKPAPTIITGRQLLLNPGGYQAWGNLTDAHKQWLQQGNFDAF
jgi:hypothetical protein